MIAVQVYGILARMRRRISSLWFVVFAAGAGIVASGCGRSAAVPRKDAGALADVAISYGGAVATGGVAGNGGAVGSGGAIALGGTTATVLGGAGGTGTGGSTMTGTVGLNTGGTTNGGSGGTAITSEGGAATTADGGTGSMGTGGAPGTGGTMGTNLNASVPCGWGFCSAGYACCVNQSTGAQDCIPTHSVCSDSFLVNCDGPEDCSAGQQCCMPSGTDIGNFCGSGECLYGLRMCHGDTDCPQGQICCPKVSFGYSHSRCVLGTSCT
jgi:hypothetical protein